MNENIITLYHGSSQIVEYPFYGGGKSYNDYGSGFYCTEHVELAKEWACTEGVSGYANKYELATEGLSVLNLNSDKYTTLNWLAILVNNRRVRVATPVVRAGIEWLRDNHLIDVKKYDIIRGYRADDAYFSFARAFLNNAISLEQLSRAMMLGELGEQFVIKSKKAFRNLKFIDAEQADNITYYARRKERDEAARAAFEEELEKADMNGVFIRDLMRSKDK